MQIRVSPLFKDIGKEAADIAVADIEGSGYRHRGNRQKYRAGVVLPVVLNLGEPSEGRIYRQKCRARAVLPVVSGHGEPAEGRELNYSLRPYFHNLFARWQKPDMRRLIPNYQCKRPLGPKRTLVLFSSLKYNNTWTKTLALSQQLIAMSTHPIRRLSS